MIKRRQIRIYPTLSALAVAGIPLVLLHPTLSGSGIPAVVVGLGLPLLVLFSFVLVLLGSIPLSRIAADFKSHPCILPAVSIIGETLMLESSLQRPYFLPGLRVFFSWRFTFGPFENEVLIPLQSWGRGEQTYRFVRRGLWLARPSLFVTDPLGFFTIRYPLDKVQNVVVPPQPSDMSPGMIFGSLSPENTTAVRFSEDAEDKAERRTYIPGDDPRRMDWKHYARTGELFVRMGEDGVLTKGRVYMMVMGSSIKPMPMAYQNLDDALAVTLRILEILDNSHQHITVRLPGDQEWLHPASDNWRQKIAGVCPASPSLANLPEAGDTLVLIAHWQDPAWGPILEKVGRLACNIIEVPLRTAHPVQRWWQHSLLPGETW